MRNGGVPGLLATLALYFEFFDGGAYDNGTTECLLLRAFVHRLEREAEAAGGGREGLEGSRRTKPGIDWDSDGDRRVD